MEATSAKSFNFAKVEKRCELEIKGLSTGLSLRISAIIERKTKRTFHVNWTVLLLFLHNANA
jgi:ribosomal protein L28